MFITLVSLILALTLTTTQVREAIAGSLPLNRMAHALWFSALLLDQATEVAQSSNA